LLQRCQVSKIRAKIYRNDEEYHCDFSILLLTPESVATFSFVDYINYLIAQQKLDRFYVDKCHCLLLATLDFQRCMTEIHHAIQRSGVQLVLHTTNLPPKMESELFDRLALPRERITIRRSGPSKGIPIIRHL
jgi:superfamily II DNA helicase RecQ